MLMMQSEAMDNLKAHMTLLFNEIKKELQDIKNDIQTLKAEPPKVVGLKKRSAVSKK